MRTALATLLIICAVPVVAWGQEEQSFAKVGGFAGGSFAPGFTLDGETFDGFTWYRQVGGDEVALLPKLDEQKMLRGILGYRYEKATIELTYERTNHNGTFAELGTGEATFQQISVNSRLFFLTRGRVQPYIMGGGGFPWLSIKDGSFVIDDPEAGIGNGSFKGYALNTEVGVTVYPHRQVGVVLGYHYRPIWFDRGSGVTDTQYKLRPRFHESTKGFVFSTLFTF